MEEIFRYLSSAVWGIGTLVLVLAAGIYITLKTRSVQVRCILKGIGLLFSNKRGGEGISPFAALCMSLSATMGTGNIIGACVAVGTGGPGAVFWMWIAGFFGMATKYFEGYNAVRYRETGENGEMNYGGPFLYMEKGIGGAFKYGAKLFALFGSLAALFGIGTLAQSNSIFASASNIWKDQEALPIICGALTALLTAFAIMGGMKRMSKVSVYLIPAMALMYIAGCILAIVSSFDMLGEALAMIFKGAFSFTAPVGGFMGAGMAEAIRTGISRGIFANESGLGSSPISAASSRETSPHSQGLVMMTGTLLDTFTVCTLTALAAIVTGVWKEGMSGAEMASRMLERGVSMIFPHTGGEVSSYILFVSIALFAFTSIVGWHYYGGCCMRYLFGKESRVLAIYNIMYVSAVFLAPFFSGDLPWYIADVFNGAMAFLNLTALVILSVKNKEIQ